MATASKSTEQKPAKKKDDKFAEVRAESRRNAKRDAELRDSGKKDGETKKA